MAIKNFPARLPDLPAFTYSKAISITNVVDRHAHLTRSKSSLHKATSFYKGKKMLPRHTTQNLLDLARWETNGRIRQPRSYPAHLHYPRDLLKAVLYSEAQPRKDKKKKKKKKRREKSKKPTSTQATTFHIAASVERCASCHASANTAEGVCDCTTPPWEEINTPLWQTQNIDLRWVDDHLGIATHALNPFERDTVLGEYLGELVPPSFLPKGGSGDDRYLFDVVDGENRIVAFIDALRVGNWTRFINHSCEPNAAYNSKRVGEELKHLIIAMKDIRKGEVVTIDYGQAYWEVMNERHVWCRCRAIGCKYNETASVLESPAKRDGKSKGKN